MRFSHPPNLVTMLEGRNILVCGRTRSGKSFLTQTLIREAEQLIVYGPKREDVGLYPGVYFDGLTDGDFELLVRWWQRTRKRCGRQRLVYRPADLFSLREFEGVCKYVYAAQGCMTGDLHFVVEEAMSYLPAINLNALGEERRPDSFIRILTAGAVRRIWLYICTQRPLCIPHLMTSQIQEAYFFAMHEASDIKYIRDSFGELAATNVERLGLYEYVHWLSSGECTIGKGGKDL